MDEQIKSAVEEAVKGAVAPLVEKLEEKTVAFPAVAKTVYTNADTNVAFLKMVAAQKKGDFQTADNIAKSINLATDAAGNYLAPQSWSTEIARAIQDYGVARNLAGRMPMRYPTMNLPTKDAGATGYWVASGAQITESSPTFSTVQLVAKKLAGLVGIDTRMFNSIDINVANYVIERLGEAMAYQEDNEYFNGNNSAPTIQGLFGDTTIGEVVMASGDTDFTDVSAAYLISLKATVPHQLRRNAKWVMSDSVFATIQKLKTTDGVPLYQTLGASEQSLLLGYPVVISSLAPSSTAADTSFILFGDFSRGTVQGIHEDMIVDVSTDFKFDYDLTYIRAIEQIDFKTVLPSYIAKLTTAAA
jgi:HK97 family phage major capsid protein